MKHMSNSQQFTVIKALSNIILAMCMEDGGGSWKKQTHCNTVHLKLVEKNTLRMPAFIVAIETVVIPGQTTTNPVKMTTGKTSWGSWLECPPSAVVLWISLWCALVSSWIGAVGALNQPPAGEAYWLRVVYCCEALRDLKRTIQSRTEGTFHLWALVELYPPPQLQPVFKPSISQGRQE